MSDKYAALKQAAEKATWGAWTAYQPHKGARGHEVKVGINAVAQHCLKNDAGYIALANPKLVLELLAERDADKARIAELVHNHRVHAAALISERAILKQRVAELEARTLTVKLPSLSPQMFNDDVMFGYRKAQREAVEFCAAHGISLKIEGE